MDYWNHLYLLLNSELLPKMCSQTSVLLLLSFSFPSFFPACFIPINMFSLHINSNKFVLTEWSSVPIATGNICIHTCRILIEIYLHCFMCQCIFHNLNNQVHFSLRLRESGYYSFKRSLPHSSLFSRRGQGEEASPELEGLRLDFLGDFM